MIAACTMTPSVVPRPSSRTCGSTTPEGAVSSSSPGSSMYSSSTVMETMLFATGAHAPGLKMPRVLSTAMNSAKMP